MDLGSPEIWRFIWLAAAVGFALGELSLVGSFFLAPFAVGAGVAAGLSFLGAGTGISWGAFLLVSTVAFMAFRPLARRLDLRSPQSSAGAGRWANREAVVVKEIPANGRGAVRLDREQWTAETLTGERVPVGSRVLVSRVEGARLVVLPLELPEPEGFGEIGGATSASPEEPEPKGG